MLYLNVRFQLCQETEHGLCSQPRYAKKVFKIQITLLFSGITLEEVSCAQENVFCLAKNVI